MDAGWGNHKTPPFEAVLRGRTRSSQLGERNSLLSEGFSVDAMPVREIVMIFLLFLCCPCGIHR